MGAMMRCLRRFPALVALAMLLPLAVARGAQEKKPESPAVSEKISFDRQIRPIFQAHCMGCHQPAKAKGAYVMTRREGLLAAGESKVVNVVPGHPEKSQLIDQITPKNGEAAMPKGKKALAPAEIELVRKWVAQGAADDTPPNAVAKFDVDHPPVYTRPPVISSIDFSPDGQTLAISGFHEILLWKADGSERLGRLVGLSERIQSLRFSPDGKLLAATGGLPGRDGEVQIWDVEKKTLSLSVSVTFDTLYGVSWSPDGTKVAFGCADNTVRAIEVKKGEAVLYNAAHNDWSLDTVWSKDGSHVASVGRDGAAKLIEVATHRFVDNITSITPGGLRGGLIAVDRHPARDEIVIGGADGAPRVYRMFRIVGRVIGDDSNLIREFPGLKGRIWSVAVSRDGKRFAAGSGLDGKGEVAVFSYEFDSTLPDKIRGIMGKVVTDRKPEEKSALDQYLHEGVREVSRAAVDEGIVYSVAFSPDGKTLAAAGGDGVVRLFETESAKRISEFSPAPVQAKGAPAAALTKGGLRGDDRQEKEALPAGAKVSSIQVVPASITLSTPVEYAQILVSAKLATGETVDVTRMAQTQLSMPVVEISRGGLVQGKAEGTATLEIRLQDQAASVPVSVGRFDGELHSDFIRDVNPVLSRVGCNAGTCHGSAKGRNGFKLSLRGYDAVLDVRALTDDLASRRVNVASPDDSLMLLKTTAAVPHEGGRVIAPGDAYYQILRSWIARGAALNRATPRVTRIELFPQNPTIERLGSRQQMRVLATYADGKTRDVTREAVIESSVTETATADRSGIMTAVRRGEAAVLARYEGAYAATTVTVMGDRKGFTWEEPPAFGRIDELVAAKWKRLKILPSGLASDAEFIRRAYLDLTGLPPTSDEVRTFMADPREVRAKRDELIKRLVGSDAYIEYWTNKWGDLLQVNRKFLGTEGASAFRKWIREEVAKNTPYNEFARKILTAEGSNRENPAASYFKILREPDATTENTTHLFLGVRFNCTKCHDHPFERWTQDQYYQTAAYFARVGLKGDPASAGKNVGGTAVEGAKPLYEIVYEKPDGEVKHVRTGQVTAPRFPYPCKFEAPQSASRRQELAAWLTSSDNPYFAKSYVNRLWGYLMGMGIIEPIDDIRAGNPPSNPQLLDFLTEEFIKNGFDTRHVVTLICTSRTYQLSVVTQEWNRDDKVNYSHALARRLPAEVLYDSIHAVTGSVSRAPGVPAGTRAAAFPDAGVELPSGFLATFGRPVRESACECERTSELRLGAVMSLISGPTIADAIADPGNGVSKLVASEKDDGKLVDELFLRILNRPARPEEVRTALAELASISQDHASLLAALARREEEWKVLQPRLEKEREEAIAKATRELADYEKAIAPRLAEEEKKRQELIAAREGELKALEDKLPELVAAWEKKQKLDVEWLHLVPSKIEASNGASLIVLPDFSILASGKNGKGNYTFVASTELRGITGVRLEAVADPKLPSQSAGRATDGNFVLTQFELSAAPKSDPAKTAKVPFQNPKADFSQQNFDVKFAVDGTPDNGRGWAISPSYGVTHWATFETKEAVGHEGGTVLTFTLRQTFNSADFMLGRFRISVTTSPRPLGLGLSDEIRAIAATPAERRDDAQKAAYAKHYRSVDGEFAKRQAAVGEAKKPLPIDPHLKELKDGLAEVSKPVRLDAPLAQLRRDAESSTKQMENLRLTMAQDLVWALINSPAFLFNR
jgi:WD40 repeat protein/mono/diheme cytochrome c family protein